MINVLIALAAGLGIFVVMAFVIYLVEDDDQVMPVRLPEGGEDA